MKEYTPPWSCVVVTTTHMQPNPHHISHPMPQTACVCARPGLQLVGSSDCIRQAMQCSLHMLLLFDARRDLPGWHLPAELHALQPPHSIQTQPAGTHRHPYYFR